MFQLYLESARSANKTAHITRNDESHNGSWHRFFPKTEDKIYPMVGINKQLTLKFVLGYTPAEYAEALAALADGSIEAEPMITRTVTLDELPAAFEALADPHDCKIVVLP